jgi:rSAM/selenodomain-associated transferase 2
MVKLSIVMPTLNEAAGVLASIQSLQSWRQNGAELVVVDGGSTDTTIELVKPWVDQVIVTLPGRATQMNAGAKVSSKDLLLFLHADTALPIGGIEQLNQAMKQGAHWGRFNVRIEGEAFMLRVISFMMNQRSKFTGIATGDQAIFVRRDLFESVGGFPNQILMEDIELSKILRRQSKPACLSGPVFTSGRRWESNGVWKTIFLMWRLRWLYWYGVEPAKLKEMYK